MDNTFESLQTFKAGQLLALAGIIHVDGKFSASFGPEEAIGHGILELVKKDPTGILLEISESNYSPGLASLGQAVSAGLQLQTQFHLDGTTRIQEGSLTTTVDGTPVSATFDPSSRTVVIDSKDAGGPRSIIEVTAKGNVM